MGSTTEALIRRHPLQRLASPTRGFSAFVHILGLASFISCYLYLVSAPTLINDSYGWHFQYLTIIGLSLATITFGLGLLADITLSPRLFLAKNTLSMASAPLEVVISTLYWGLRAIDRKLVIPEFMSLHPLADLGFHLAPAAYLALDLLFLSPPWTIAILPAMGLSLSLACAYWAWVEHCYSHNGWYPYPLFEQLNTPSRALLFLLSAVIMTGSTATLKWLYGRVNGFGDGTAPRARPGAVKRS